MREAFNGIKSRLSMNNESSQPGGFPDVNCFAKLQADPRTRQFLDDPGYVQIIKNLQQNIEGPRLLTTLNVLLGVDKTSTGDSMDIDPPSSTQNEPKPATTTKSPEPEPTENSTDDELKNEKELGNAAYKKKEFETALKHYNNAVELDPTNMTYYTNIAAVYFEQKEYRQCIETCEKAVEIGRKNRADFKLIAKAFARIGNAYTKMKDWRTAEVYFKKSMSKHRTPEVNTIISRLDKKIKEDEMKAYIEKGNELFNKGDYVGAVKFYTEAIKRNPDEPKYYSNRAECYTKLAEFNLALKDCDKCTELDPKFLKGWIRKGKIFQGMQQHSKAIAAYLKALELDSTNCEALEGYKSCSISTNSNSEVEFQLILGRYKKESRRQYKLKRKLSDTITRKETVGRKLRKVDENLEKKHEPYSVDVFKSTNMEDIINFIFDIEKYVISEINAFEAVKGFMKLFHVDQSCIICITRPPCWGKTTMIHTLFLYLGVTFKETQFPQFVSLKVPLEIFYGEQSLKKDDKEITFRKTVREELQYDDRASWICILLNLSVIDGDSLSEMSVGFKTAVLTALQPFREYLNKDPEFIQCSTEHHFEGVQYLKLITTAIGIFLKNGIFETYPGILFIDEVDLPLIKIKDQSDARKLRKELENFIRCVRLLRLKVITFGVFPELCYQIMPNKMANTCTVTHDTLRSAFGFDSPGKMFESNDGSLRDSANGFTYPGTNKYSLYCAILWKNSQTTYPEDVLKHKSFSFIERKFHENKGFIKLAFQLLKNEFESSTKHENSSLRENLYTLYHAGFVVKNSKEELSTDVLKKVLQCSELTDKEALPDDIEYFVFPNTIMRNSLKEFLGNVKRTKLVSRFGENYLSEVKLEFIDRNQTAIVERICATFKCTRITRERDYEDQLSDYLLPVLEKSFFVLNQLPSGSGILDIILLPKNKNFPMYVIEAKFNQQSTEDKLENSCLKAFHQIHTLKYYDKVNSPTTDILFIGVAVSKTSIYCSIAEKTEFSQCRCPGSNKDIVCEVVKRAERLNKFRVV